MYGIFFSEFLNFAVIACAASRDYVTFSSNCIYNREHPEFNRMQELIEILKNPDLSEKDKNYYTIERTKLSLFEPEKYHDFFNQDISKKINASRIDYFSRELKVFDVTKKLELMTVPVLVMDGKYDVQCPLEYSLEMHDKFQCSKLIIFEQSNHYPFLEESGLFEQEFNLFLEECDMQPDFRS